MRFHLGTVLTVTTGRLLCPSGMEGVYKILNFMTGEDVYTHQIPRAVRTCRPYLVRQFPCLADVNASEVTSGNWRAWLEKMVRAHGEHLEVVSLPAGAYEYKDPIAELAEMMSIT